MTVYIDDACILATVGPYTARWSHLFADTEEELHAFAHMLGLRREWFQPGNQDSGQQSPFWHYDLTERKRQQAIQLGATPVTWRKTPHLTRARSVLANQADHAAGLAWRAGAIDRAEQLIETALLLDPGRADLWAARLRTINDPTLRTQPAAVSSRETGERPESPGPAREHEATSATQGELSTQPSAAGIDPADPALAAIRQWNAAAYRRAARPVPGSEAAQQ